MSACHRTAQLCLLGMSLTGRLHRCPVCCHMSHEHTGRFCYTGVRICWGRCRTDTWNPGSHPHKCKSRCQQVRPCTAHFRNTESRSLLDMGCSRARRNLCSIWVSPQSHYNIGHSHFSGSVLCCRRNRTRRLSWASSQQGICSSVSWNSSRKCPVSTRSLFHCIDEEESGGWREE